MDLEVPHESTTIAGGWVLVGPGIGVLVAAGASVAGM